MIKSERPYDDCYEDEDISITVIDGRDRVMCFERVLSKIKNRKQIIVLDNTERMDYKYSEYISLIKRYGFNSIHFEQHQLEHEGRRFTTRSYARDRVYHRHITTICFLEGCIQRMVKLSYVIHYGIKVNDYNRLHESALYFW